MTFELITTTQNGRVGVIHLNRPQKHNALSFQLMHEVLQAAQSFDADPNIGCLVLMGHENSFSVGADIQELSQQTYASMREGEIFSHWDQFARLGIPKLAAVSGYALGGGCEIAMMCDVIIGADTAQFGQPEVKIGCIPGMGGTQRLTHLVGRACAMDMILTGRMIDAQEALRIGLISRVYSVDALEEGALEIARQIASHPRDIVRMARECVSMAQETPQTSGLQYERQTYYALFGHPDQKEGMSAFLEKRDPRFN